MKKNRSFTILCLMLVLLQILFVSGCGTAKTTIASQDGTTATTKANGATQSAGPTTATQSQGETTVAPTTSAGERSLVLINAMQRYMDVKKVSYEAIAKKMEADPTQALNMMGLMGVAMMDLSLIPVTYLAGLQAAQDSPLWSGNLLMLEGTGKVEKAGSKYLFEATITDPNNPFSMTGEYDEQSDSMQYTMSSDGKDTVYFEYVRCGEGYASQYFTFPTSADDTPDNNLIKLFSIGQDIYVGYVSAAVKPQPIYGTSPATRKAFLTGCTSTYILESDVITVATEP
jgi:hypothetical protein